ncbi:MAG TPA: Gfo/Idh/MocA family oxidoreductase [Terriglobia bacterium]|nr:Gfo/Idh/MocA family oxidoreductase [Terriglobia bacterium]
MNGPGIAVVGCGYWGQNLIRNFWELEAASLAMVCDADAKVLSKTVRRYPAVKPALEYAAVLRDPAVDAVVIATPVSTHYDFACRALEAGKHVLVEKPMAQSTAEVLELIERAERHRRRLMVDHTFLYTGAVRRMKQLIDSGEIGEMLYFDSVRINLGLVQSDSNVLWDLGPHDFSILDHLCGADPRAVSATAVKHLGCPHEDVAYVTVRFDSSLIAHFHLNWLSPVKVRLTLVGGSRKMLVYDDLEPSEKVKVYDRGITVNQDPERRARMLTGYRNGDMLAPQLDSTEALRLMAREFVNSIVDGRPPMTNGTSGYRVVRLLEAAQRSIELNGREIELGKAALPVIRPPSPVVVMAD